MSTSADLSEKTVLVIDDDQSNIFALRAYLERDGVDVLTEERAEDGLERLRENDEAVDLVLIDIKMPEMDGYEATRAIRERLGREALPVVAVTGKASDEERQRCLDAGATDYLSKPIDLERLIAIMRENLS